MLVFSYLQADPSLADALEESYPDAQAATLGPDVVELWISIRRAAQAEARRETDPSAAGN